MAVAILVRSRAKQSSTISRKRSITCTRAQTNVAECMFTCTVLIRAHGGHTQRCDNIFPNIVPTFACCQTWCFVNESCPSAQAREGCKYICKDLQAAACAVEECFMCFMNSGIVVSGVRGDRHSPHTISGAPCMILLRRIVVITQYVLK